MALLIWTENLPGWAAISEWLPENPWPFVLLGVVHVALGNVIWGLVMLLLVGALPGVMLGSELAARAPHRLLRTAFSVGAVLAGLKLI